MTSAADLAARIAARPLGPSGLPPELLQAYDVGAAVSASLGTDPVSGLEGEVSQELRRQLEGRDVHFRDPRSLVVPPGVLFGAALQAGTQHGGRELVHPSTAHWTMAPALRPTAAVQRLGATIITDAPGAVALPRFSGGLTPVWITPEVPDDPQALSTPTTAADVLPIRQGMVSTAWSRQIDRQTPELRPLITRDVFLGAAQLLDQAALVGTGQNGQPEGLLARSAVSAVSMGTDGGAITWPKVLEIEETAHEQEGRPGWVTTKRVRRILRNIPEIGTGGRPTWRDGRILDAPAIASSNMPGNLSKGNGTNLHGLVYSPAWEHLVIVILAIELVVDPFTLGARGLTTGRLYLHGGVGVVHPGSFAKAVDIVGTV